LGKYGRKRENHTKKGERWVLPTFTQAGIYRNLAKNVLNGKREKRDPSIPPVHPKQPLKRRESRVGKMTL